MQTNQAALFCLAILALLNSARADNPPPRGGEADLVKPLLDRVRLIAANDDWRKTDWRDEKLDADYEKLVSVAVSKAELRELRPPLRMFRAPVAKAADNPLWQVVGTPLNGALFVGQDAHLSMIKQSIVLIDGDLAGKLVSVEDSIIIARGAITVGTTHVRRSVLIAGTYINVSTVGDEQKPGDGSIIISRGWVDSSSSIDHSIVAAPGGAIARGSGSAYINTELPLGAQADTFGNRSIIVPQLALGSLPSHPLSQAMEVIGVMHGPKAPNPQPVRFKLPARIEPLGLVFKLSGKRYIADVGEQIGDQAGNAVQELAGWKLNYVSDNMAIFRKGEEAAPVRIAER